MVAAWKAWLYRVWYGQLNNARLFVRRDRAVCDRQWLRTKEAVPVNQNVATDSYKAQITLVIALEQITIMRHFFCRDLFLTKNLFLTMASLSPKRILKERIISPLREFIHDSRA